MIKSIVRYLMKKRAQRDSRRPAMVRGDVLSSVAVIASHQPQSFDVARAYVRELAQRGIPQVDFYIHFKQNKAKAAFEPAGHEYPFSPKSFNPFGKFKASELSQGVGKEYDLLIDLTDGSSLAADVVISKLNSKWKAGRRTGGRDYLFDFMINSKDGDLRNLCHHINEYVLNFNKLNAA